MDLGSDQMTNIVTAYTGLPLAVAAAIVGVMCVGANLALDGYTNATQVMFFLCERCECSLHSFAYDLGRTIYLNRISLKTAIV